MFLPFFFFFFFFNYTPTPEIYTYSHTLSLHDARPISDEPSQKIRIIGTLPLKSYATTAVQNFKKDVQKGTNSKLEVDIFPAGQLYNDVDAVKVIPTGAVDMGVVNLDFWTGLVPSAGILYMPTYYKNLKYFYAVRDYVTPILDKDLQKRSEEHSLNSSH